MGPGLRVLQSQGIGERIAKITGLPLDPMFSGTRASWLLDAADPVRNPNAPTDLPARHTVGNVADYPRPETGRARAVPDIEWAAGTLFIDVGLADVAAHEPESVEALAEYANDGRAWVITAAADDVPVGYAIVDIVDGLAHLEQLSVLPNRGRKGLGAALLAHVCDWAASQRFDAVTLTTFTDIPWNAPFYAKHGFRVMDGAEIGRELGQRGRVPRPGVL